MEIAANGDYPFVPIAALHAIVDGYGLPCLPFMLPTHSQLACRPDPLMCKAPRRRDIEAHVCYWHIADIDFDAEHASFGGKADSPLLTKLTLLEVSELKMRAKSNTNNCRLRKSWSRWDRRHWHPCAALPHASSSLWSVPGVVGRLRQ
jgi:hypothetical protein